MKYSQTWVAVVVVGLIGCGVSAWHLSAQGGVKAEESAQKEGDARDKGTARPPYVHSVVFYLKEDAPKGEVERIIADAYTLLAKIPSVKGLWIGRPAEKATPKLAVSDYHVAWTLLFDDYAGLQEYLEHKLHVEFREKHAKHAERVLIYDYLNQTK